MSKIVSLEITSHAIRATEIKGYNTKKAKFIKFGEVKLEPGVARESQVIDGERFTEALKDLWSTFKFSTREVGLIVGGSRFTVRPHVTSSRTLDAVRNMLPIEGTGALAGQNPETLTYDFLPVRTFEDKTGEKTEGLVVSSPSEPLTELIFHLGRANLALEYVEFAPFAVVRWIKNNLEEKNAVLVNVRDESTDISIIRNGVPQMVRVVAKGLDTSKRKLKEMSRYERMLLLANPSEAEATMLAQDVEMSIKAQPSALTHELQEVYVSGARAKDEELLALLTEKLELPITSLRVDSIEEAHDEENNMEPTFDAFVPMAGGMRA